MHDIREALIAGDGEDSQARVMTKKKKKKQQPEAQ
eukprot:CAMPEP_0202961496 /NCGR_PEP_ID=MMETSP1396-20130829/5551_1 /ASSEMBLY_ACC=CAM_ASM_000872 /TAXON_ID= /ORGANISM="Pseudokeronopsis sp., Strain Brazil" /LENGTH=34 /DNA_ID= /DNA_START= /DNA_END= /DNA_ORIENTATION=